MRRQYFDYRPRPQFRAFHRRKERFATVSVRSFSRGLVYPNLGIV